MAEVALFYDDKLAKKFLKSIEEKITASKEAERKYVIALASKVYEDIIRHFESEEGSDGPWTDWSDSYFRHLESIGRSGKKILHTSGRLRQGIAPIEKGGNYRSTKEGILWYNPVKTKSGFPYAFAHDEGGPILPKRDFMWLSNAAMEKIAEVTLGFILDEGV